MNTKHSHQFQFLELVSTTYVKFSMQGVCVEYGPFVSRRIPFEYLINKADVASCSDFVNNVFVASCLPCAMFYSVPSLLEGD